MNIHDCGYKKLFSNKTIFRELLETFVHLSWVQDLDFERCEKLDKSFVSEHYKETESDIIYKVHFKQSNRLPAYVLILVEFQSTVQRFMAVRMLSYVTNFYMDYIAAHKNAHLLPPIFPIVLYNGDAKWTAPTNIKNLIEHANLFDTFIPHLDYFKIAENEFSKQELLKIKNVVSTLFLAEAHYDIELLKQELITVFNKAEDKKAISILLNWFEQLVIHGRHAQADYDVLNHVYQNQSEVKQMLLTAIQKEHDILRNQGIQQGKTEGIQEERERMVKELLFKDMDIAFISSLTKLSEQDVIKIKKKLEH
ncbi:Rpn family recombination-promoting nuclease/putative transposase [Candidatus Albibeggiatoa sp. nov. NOAA]|uniref:Rpn family recombination-promoting nuclease/putative transposase n=1 Tax=Candidatus Albibeggiatoa sp. nov. NOAA TaxID=3162724 RepID=UPI0032FC7B6E|nr:Rpn family recombination-promoting nuclease/putative transposase [Thiotrichaceae bacterium]